MYEELTKAYNEQMSKTQKKIREIKIKFSLILC